VPRFSQTTASIKFDREMSRKRSTKDWTRCEGMRWVLRISSTAMPIGSLVWPVNCSHENQGYKHGPRVWSEGSYRACRSSTQCLVFVRTDCGRVPYPCCHVSLSVPSTQAAELTARGGGGQWDWSSLPVQLGQVWPTLPPVPQPPGRCERPHPHH